MRNPLRIAFGAFLLLVSFIGASLNLSTAANCVFFVVAIGSLHFLTVITDGFFTGYMERINGNLGDVRDAVRVIFESSKKEILILTGLLSPVVYFSDEVFSSLDRAISRGVRVTILFAEPSATLESLRAHTIPERWGKFLSWIQDRSVVVLKTPNADGPHLILVDKDHVRIEYPHKKRIALDSDERRRARTVYFDENIQNHVRRFEKLAQSALPLFPTEGRAAEV